MTWSNPEQAPQIDAQVRGILWIERVSEIYQSGRLPAGRGGRQSREREGESTAARVADEFDQLAALHPPAEEPIQGCDASRLNSEGLLVPAIEFASTVQTLPKMVGGGGDELLGGRDACHFVCA